MVKMGTGSIEADCTIRLPKTRRALKQDLRNIAKSCGVGSIYFVKTTTADYGGHYSRALNRIVIVEQQGQRKVRRITLVFRFFHELTHHLHVQYGLFSAYYFTQSKAFANLKDPALKKRYGQAAKRVALKAERHANQKAGELAEEFYGLDLEIPEYPKEYLHTDREDIFG